MPLLSELEPGLSEPVLREADALARAIPQFAGLANLSSEAQDELSRTVSRARPDITAATDAELAELAAHVRLYRGAVEAALATHEPVLSERLESLESRIAELQQMQDERVADERRQRMQIDDEQEARRLDRLRESVSGTAPVVKAPRPFWRRAPMSQVEADRLNYQKQLEALQLKKREIADIVTEKKRFRMQLERLHGQAERAVAALPEVRGEYAAAAIAFERAVEAVAHRGLVPVYSAWIMESASASGYKVEVDDPYFEEIAEDPSADFDVFISHASEDKDHVARPLAEALRQRDLKVWIDEQELTLGDSLSRKIDDGLSRSRFGVVVLSHAFFRKNWPQRELEGLVSRETMLGYKVILPVWHGVTEKDVQAKSPTLASRLAIDAADGVEAVADAIMRALRRST